jgi:solute carrier family 25 protein 38
MNAISPQKKRKLTKAFAAGSVSGCFSSVIFQPLDLIKTRLQSQPVLVRGINVAAVSINGDLTLMRSLLFNKNVIGLWKGLAPSLCRTIPGVGLYFSTLESLKGSLKISQPTLIQNFALGFTARSFAGTVLLPVTVIKARFESGQFNYPSIMKAFQTIWMREGMRGLYSGASATLARDAPYSGLYLMFYGAGKQFVSSVNHNDSASPILNYACGINAGLVASIVTQPADVIKTKMQLHPQKYRNSLHCIRTVLTESGSSGLLRGITPRCMRRALISAMSWTVYEELFVRMKLKD